VNSQAIAAVLSLVPQTQIAPSGDLSDLERASGWVSMSDEANRSSWEKPAEGWSFEGRILRRAATARTYLGWSGVLAEFELDFEWRESSMAEGPWLPGRVVMNRDNSALALLGEIRLDRAANSDLPSFRAGPFELTPAQTEPGWHVALRPGDTALELRALHLRDRAKEVGKRVEIFDGRTLNGWRALGDAKYTVVNGELIGEVGGGSQSFLRTEQEFGDFIFEVELKNDQPGNSGIQVRSHENDKQRLFGYQIEIDPSARAWSGGLYDEARRGWLDDLSDNPHGRLAFRNGEWNRYRIECIGPWIRAWVNDVPTADFLDAKDLEGAFGLQVHSGNNTKMRWRKFRLLDLGRSHWSDELDLIVLADTPGHGLVLGKRGGALRLHYGSAVHAADAPAPVEKLRLDGPDWVLPIPMRDMRGEDVLILCYPPRTAVEIDGRRIPNLTFNVADARERNQEISAWVEIGRAWNESSQTLRRN
jgi:hypothetical protein